MSASDDGFMLSASDSSAPEPGALSARPAEEWDASEVTQPKKGNALYLELDGWEGPLDLLLDLARRQKVDLRQISILALVDQYLGHIERAEALKLEVAADYLVMAAWLA
ncbi:MAG: segregation/condensation protein A, partial [Pseudomonadota bacterium]